MDATVLKMVVGIRSKMLENGRELKIGSQICVCQTLISIQSGFISKETPEGTDLFQTGILSKTELKRNVNIVKMREGVLAWYLPTNK